MRVAVAVGVIVGKGVVVDRGVNVAIIGVDVGARAKDAQDERTKVSRINPRMKEVNLFRMDCILPLVE